MLYAKWHQHLPTWYEVLDDVHVRKWVNLCCLAAVINLADAGKGVHTTDVHGAAAADALAARPTFNGKKIYFLYLKKIIQRNLIIVFLNFFIKKAYF